MGMKTMLQFDESIPARLRVLHTVEDYTRRLEEGEAIAYADTQLALIDPELVGSFSVTAANAGACEVLRWLFTRFPETVCGPHCLAIGGLPSSVETRRDCLVHRASFYGQLGVVRMLVEEYGADATSSFNGREQEAVHNACRSGNVELVRYLLDKGATPNSTANGCHAAYTLIKAADYGFPEIARLLVERGALVNSPNLMGLTPLNFATGTMIPAKSPEQDAGRKAVFEYLRSVGAQFPWELRGEPDPQLIPPTLTTKPKSKKRK